MKMMIASGVLAAGVFAGHFQMPSTPPMKLGLWETTSTLNLQMPDVPQMQGRPPQVVKVRSCLTAESWAKAFGNSGRRSECSLSNQTVTASHYSFDISCPSMSGKGHADLDFSNEGSGHGKLHMEASPSGHAVVMDTVYDSHFVSADCGTVAPDKPQILR